VYATGRTWRCGGSGGNDHSPKRKRIANFKRTSSRDREVEEETKKESEDKRGDQDTVANAKVGMLE